MKFLILITLYPALSFAFTFPEKFLFGVASAPAHVEDDLNDPWLSFAREGHIRAFDNTPSPELRLLFWTQPEKEISLLEDLGVEIFRLGVSWSRLVPNNPYDKNGKLNFRLDQEAVRGYTEIFKKIKTKNIQIMLTLFHHSMPSWAHKLGGFKNPLVQNAFIEFSKKVYDDFHPSTDYWITFNESNVYSFMTHVQGLWPFGKKDIFATIKIPFYKGRYFEELDGMAKAHEKIYDYIKKKNSDSPVSIAHNFASYQGEGLMGSFLSYWGTENMNYYFVDAVKEKLDFLGMNYYGAEFFKGRKLIFKEKTLYSEAGRAISPIGFLQTMKKAHQRYELPLFITENGVADRTDIIRGPYLVEHLKAISYAMDEGVNVMGYIHWTLSDNWEWADGYCPKFGLVAVDRMNNFKRIKRPSFRLYQEIIKKHSVDTEVYEKVWRTFLEDQTENYWICRDKDQEAALDEARATPLKAKNFKLKEKK